MSCLAPSILSADFNCLGEQIRMLEQTGIEFLHIDVMDGMFVPSISFGMPVIASIRKSSQLFFDVHLMVQEPERYLKEFADAGADGLTVHAEACSDLGGTLKKIRDLGMKPAVSVNPETPLSEILSVLDQVDMVLVMSVHPGFGGQKMIMETLEKVEQLKEFRRKQKLCYTIEIDGGVNQQNIAEITARGVDIVVAGTAVFQGDIAKNVQMLREGMTHAS